MKRLVATLLAFGSLAACSTSIEAGPAAASPGSTPKAGAFTRPAALSGEPCGLEVSEDHLWILSCSGTLFRIAKRGAESRTSHLGGEVLSLDGLARGSAGRLWALLSRRSTRTRNGTVGMIDVRSGDLRSTVDVGGSVPMSAAERDGGLWVGMLDGRLLSIRDGSASVVASGGPLVWVTAEASALWTMAEDGDATLRDPATGSERSMYEGIAPEPIAAAAAFGALWAATPSRTVHLDPATGTARTLDVDGTVNGMEPCGEHLWVSQPDFGVRSLTMEGAVATALRLEVAPRYLACDGPVLWVLTEDGRIGSIRIQE